MSNHEIFHTKDNKEELRNFEVLKRPMLKFQAENHDSISSGSESHSQAQREDNTNQEKEEEEQLQNRIVLSKHSDSESTSTPSSREVQHKVEDDGFRTPTSLEQKIPEAKQCPPAPRKPKPSMKRKATQNSCSCRHPLDLSKEVAIELLFPTQQHHPFSDSHQSTKKVRIEEP